MALFYSLFGSVDLPVGTTAPATGGTWKFTLAGLPERDDSTAVFSFRAAYGFTRTASTFLWTVGTDGIARMLTGTPLCLAGRSVGTKTVLDGLMIRPIGVLERKFGFSVGSVPISLVLFFD